MASNDPLPGRWGRELFSELSDKIHEQRRELANTERQVRDLQHRLRRVTSNPATSGSFNYEYEPLFLRMAAARSDRTSQSAVAIKCSSFTVVSDEGTANIDDKWIFKQLFLEPGRDERVGVPFEYRVSGADEAAYRVEINERPGSETRKNPFDDDQLIIERASVSVGDYWTIARQGDVRLRVCRRNDANLIRASFCKAFLFAVAGVEVDISFPPDTSVQSARVLVPKSASLPTEERMRYLEDATVDTSGAGPTVSYRKDADDILRLGREQALINGSWPPWPVVNVVFTLPSNAGAEELVELKHERLAECGGPQCPQV